MGGHSTRLLGCNYDPHSSRLPSLWAVTEKKEPAGAMNPWARCHHRINYDLAEHLLGLPVFQEYWEF
jgi:hypothetical protein